MREGQMKRKVLWRSIILTSVAFFAASGTLNAQTLTNGGFETGTKAKADGWKPTYAHWINAVQEYVEFKKDDKFKHGGQYSASIENLQGHPWHTIHYNWNTVLEGWEFGKKYELTAWIKTENIKRGVGIVVQCWNTKEEQAGTMNGMKEMFKANGGELIKGTNDWKQVKVRFKVSKGIDQVVIIAGLISQEKHRGQVWFDDFEVIEVKGK
jgi:hypothetical protein